MSTLPACCTPTPNASEAEILYCANLSGGDPEKAGLSWDGRPCPMFADLPPNVVAKWEATADAAAQRAPVVLGLSAAVLDILAERERAIADGYDADHDDEHTDGSLAYAAAHLASEDGLGENSDTVPQWAINLSMKCGGDRYREIVIAAQLVIAEAERLRRAGAADDTP